MTDDKKDPMRPPPDTAVNRSAESIVGKADPRIVRVVQALARHAAREAFYGKRTGEDPAVNDKGRPLSEKPKHRRGNDGTKGVKR